MTTSQQRRSNAASGHRNIAFAEAHIPADQLYFNTRTESLKSRAGQHLDHRRLIELGRELPVDLNGGAIFHAGPIVRQKEDGEYEMVSIGPTTSMRMEKFEKDFIKQTGVKLIVGKGGMGEETQAGCVENKAVHAIFPGGCAVLAATKVEKIEGAEWKDLGMPETLWINCVKDFGPLIISIDTKGRNLIEENKKVFNEKRKPILERINQKIRFIK